MKLGRKGGGREGGGREGMWEGVGMRMGGMEGEEGRRKGGVKDGGSEGRRDEERYGGRREGLREPERSRVTS